MKQLLFLTITCLVLLLSSCGNTTHRTHLPQDTTHTSDLTRLTASGVVKVGIKVDAAPFGYTIGSINAGYDVDVIVAVCSRIGLSNIRFVPVTSSNRFDLLQSGAVDIVIASTSITRSREAHVDFSIPYFQDGQGLLTATTSDITSYQDLTDKKVGCVTGATSAGIISKVAPSSTVVLFPDYTALTAALLEKEIDAASSDSLILMGMQNAAPSGRLHLAGPIFTTEPYGIAVRENQSDLRDALSGALQDMWDAGELQNIIDIWFGPATKYKGNLSFTMTTLPE